MVYGGLRGAVGLALALIVKDELRDDGKVWQLVVFHTAMIAILTLFINGTTTGFLLRGLRMLESSTWKELTLIRIAQQIEDDTEESLKELKFERKEQLKWVDWTTVS